MASKPQNMDYYRQGQSYAETLVREEPNRVEDHYWLAMNLCGQADAGGQLLGRKLLPRILEELKRSLALDEAYDQAGAHRVLGRIYYEAPGWPLSVGDLKKSLQHLQAAVRLAPAISTNHLYLAQTLLRLQDNSAATQELQQVLKSTRGAVKPQDLEEDRQEARRLLGEIKGGKPGSRWERSPWQVGRQILQNSAQRRPWRQPLRSGLYCLIMILLDVRSARPNRHQKTRILSF